MVVLFTGGVPASARAGARSLQQQRCVGRSLFRWSLASAVGLVLLAGAPAHASSSWWRDRPETPFQLKLELDLPLLLISLPSYLLTREIQNSLPPPSCGQPGHLCNFNDIPWFDRHTIYFNAALRTPADILFIWAPIAVSGALLVVDYGPFRLGSFLTDIVIVLESMGWSAFLSHLARFGFRRPRPYLYYDGIYSEQRGGADAESSFWSGHVAELMAFSVSTAYIFMQRHHSGPAVVVMWVALVGAGVADAIFRVGSGDHFLSDVVAGAAVGAGTGLIIPWLHPRKPPKVMLVPTSTQDSFGLAVSGRF